MEHVVADKSGNTMFSTEENGNLYNAETFAYLGAIRLLLRLFIIIKFKLDQMDMRSHPQLYSLILSHSLPLHIHYYFFFNLIVSCMNYF